ncbi:MAG: hypothetical protein BA867_00905 [Desulfobacterales bacterium S5133MH16]|nr:MAG: hypothetical protein BA867_00905 [Desulfobacterales bacterium S5133MH16]
MEQIFLYQQWLRQRLHEYVHVSRPPKLRGRKIVMSPSQYGAALMQAYFGRASLTWIAEHVGIPVQLLRQWRQEPQFLLTMDWSKSVFSKDFQEKLMLNDYSMAQYYSMAAEISLLEESFRLTVRMPLNQRFVKIGRFLMSRHQNDLDLNNYDLRLFRRLFLFFLALDNHWPGSACHCVSEDFLTLARDVVWPLLNQKQWVGQELKSIQQAAPISRILIELDSKLKETFQTVLA